MIPAFAWIVAVSIYLLVRPSVAATAAQPAARMSASPAGTS
jgi:hypothetical protein